MQRSILFVALASAGVLGLAFCQSRETQGSPPAEHADEAPTADVPRVEDGAIVVPAPFASAIGLEFADVASSDLEPVIHVVGTVGFDEKKVAAVGSRIAGRVAQVSVSEGDQVKAGALLGTIESAELGTAQADVYGATAKYEAAKSQETRRKNLLEEGVSSKRMAEEAIASAAIARAELLAARQRVEALGGDSRSKKLGLAGLRTPIDGQVIAVEVYRGEAVSMSDNLFTIADLSSVWVNLAVFEDDLDSINEGDPVEIRTPADPELKLQGQIHRVGSVIDPESRSARVRVIVDNPEEALRIGQSVSAKVRTKGETRHTLTVPRDALVRIDGEPTVFVEIGEGRVEVRRVTLGDSAGDMQEITDGLKAGERIAVKGVFGLKSEIFR
jgi:cobalt-zinc-cadmium efflux system membrane fusion protein